MKPLVKIVEFILSHPVWSGIGAIATIIGLILVWPRGDKSATPTSVASPPMSTPTMPIVLMASATPNLAPTNTAAISPTWTPESPMPTATPTNTPYPVPGWSVVFCDDFGTDINGWDRGTFDGDQYTMTANLVDGQYLVGASAKHENTWRSFKPDTLTPLTDFYYATDVVIRSGSPDATAALIFRYDHGREVHYAFEIKEPNLFRVRRYDLGERVVVIDWQATDAIKSQQVNRLAVLGHGNNYDFIINGELVATASDDVLSGGIIGALVRLAKVSDVVEIAFDNVEVRAPDRAANPQCAP